jgi:hypothetical protein
VYLVPEVRSPRWTSAALVFVVAAAGSALRVHQDQTPDASRWDAVVAQRSATAPGDLVISDDQYTVSLAGRRTPPALVDTSLVRVQAGDLTTAQVATSAERGKVSCVLVDERYGALSAMPGFRRWVAQRYPDAHRLSHGRTLYLRAPCGDGRSHGCARGAAAGDWPGLGADDVAKQDLAP